MTRRTAALLLVIGAAAWASGPFLATSAGAAEPVPIAGSWTQLRLSTPLGTGPDLQSAEGEALPVTNGPLGAVAVSAVKLDLGASSLSLARTDPGATTTRGTPVPTPSIWACGVKTAWSAGNRQPWADRPVYDCTAHAVGTDRAGIVTWNLGGLAMLSQTNVALVPDPTDTSTFSVTFGAPVASSFSLASDGQTTEQQPLDEPVIGEQPGSTGPDAAAPSGSAPAPGLQGGILSSPLDLETAGLPPQTATEAPAVATPTRATATAPAAQTSSTHQWTGPALLAFLALLVMVRTARPLSPMTPATSLLSTPAHQSQTQESETR